MKTIKKKSKKISSNGTVDTRSLDYFSILLEDIRGQVRFIAEQQHGFNDKFEQIDRRFDQVDKKFEQIDRRFDQVDRRFEQVDRRFEQVDKRFGEVDKKFDEIDEKFSVVMEHFDNIGEETREIKALLANKVANEDHNALKARVLVLESNG